MLLGTTPPETLSPFVQLWPTYIHGKVGPDNPTEHRVWSGLEIDLPAQNLVHHSENMKYIYF